MTEPLLTPNQFMNRQLRRAAGYTETADTTETERPNAEMNDLLRLAAGQSIKEESNAEG